MVGGLLLQVTKVPPAATYPTCLQRTSNQRTFRIELVIAMGCLFGYILLSMRLILPQQTSGF
jgi:hypothetical protein